MDSPLERAKALLAEHGDRALLEMFARKREETLKTESPNATLECVKAIIRENDATATVVEDKGWDYGFTALHQAVCYPSQTLGLDVVEAVLEVQQPTLSRAACEHEGHALCCFTPCAASPCVLKVCCLYVPVDMLHT